MDTTGGGGEQSRVKGQKGLTKVNGSENCSGAKDERD